MNSVNFQDIKINLQKLVAFVYTNNISFIIATKYKKPTLGTNLTKEVKIMYIENYKTLMRKLKKTQMQMEMYFVFMNQKK